MSKRAFSRAYDMPTIDPDKEDETKVITATELEKRKDAAYKRMAASFKKPEKGDCGNAFEKATGELIRKWLAKGFEDVEDVYEREYNCPVVAKSGCDHSWTSYTGLSESFEFCKHCDEKR